MSTITIATDDQVRIGRFDSYAALVDVVADNAGDRLTGVRIELNDEPTFRDVDDVHEFAVALLQAVALARKSGA